jgi:zinc transport system substrate-binding protein
MKPIARVFAALAFLLTSVWLPPADAKQVKSFVSIAPQQYFVQKIGGDMVDVAVLVPPGADPHTYEPKPRQMAELAKAAVFFAVGIDFEKAWMKKIAATNPNMRIVDTDAGIEKMALPAHHHEEKGHTHSHGKKKSAHAHDHAGGPDPHVWLSPPLVKIQARHIADGLIAVDSANRSRYEENLAGFLREIEALDSRLESLVCRQPGRPVHGVSPLLGLFAQRPTGWSRCRSKSRARTQSRPS